MAPGRSSTRGKPAADASSERPGKLDSWLIFSVLKAALPKAPRYVLGVFEVTSAEVIYAKDRRSLRAGHNGVFLPLIPGEEFSGGRAPLFPIGVSVTLIFVTAKRKSLPQRGQSTVSPSPLPNRGRSSHFPGRMPFCLLFFPRSSRQPSFWPPGSFTVSPPPVLPLGRADGARRIRSGSLDSRSSSGSA